MSGSWVYSQKTGALTSPSGEVLAVGYSGAGAFMNRPIAERLEDRGPIPTGTYTIEGSVEHPTCGPCSLPLEPHPDNEMHGRSAFLIHGDSIDDPGTASTGCIIMPRDVRDQIAASDVRQLVVVV
jgi:hypothetical protein